MYPIGANGGSQAIRDGSALADAFATYGDPQAALQAYEAERREATTRIVESNRRLGPEQVMQMAEERAPNGFTNIEDVIARRELEDISAKYRTITWADAKREAHSGS
jgi:2-polyprenyl-6-methoxyphenol hydroxylase-like FAD-dependent oxidoreductase